MKNARDSGSAHVQGTDTIQGMFGFSNVRGIFGYSIVQFHRFVFVVMVVAAQLVFLRAEIFQC